MTDIARISDAFVSARREGRALAGFPGDVPASLQAAYAVQAHSVEAWGEPVVGYKVGGIPPQWREQFPSNWLAGPVFPSLVMETDFSAPVDVPVFKGGFAAYEPELVFHLEGLSAPRDILETPEQAKSYIRAVHLGAEIASSPLPTINALGPGSIISDFGNQAGVIIGPEIDRAHLDALDRIKVTTEIDGEVVGSTSVNATDGGPLGALRFLLNHLRDHPRADGADTAFLSSGAITGVHASEVGTRCTINYHDLGVLRINMVARPVSAAHV